MLEIIRDSLWQFITVVIAIIAIIVSIILYLIQRRRKALSWEIISNTPLLSIDEEIKGDLQILFAGKPVQDIQLIILKIINSGNIPIKYTEYERPIYLKLGENAQILSAKVTEKNPSNLETSVKINKEGTRAELEPTLMNEGDSFTIKMLVNQFDGQIIVDDRVEGVKVKEIQKTTASKFQFTLSVDYFGLIILLILLFILIKLF